MFLENNYILGNELAQKMNMHIANISMLAQSLENTNADDTIKMNNCTFINAESINLPKNIKHGIWTNKFADMSNKLPCTYVRSEYNVTEKELFKSGIVEGKTEIAGKKFYVFKADFVEKVKGRVIYMLDKDDCESCVESNSIDGFIELSKNKFLSWY